MATTRAASYCQRLQRRRPRPPQRPPNSCHRVRWITLRSRRRGRSSGRARPASNFAMELHPADRRTTAPPRHSTHNRAAEPDTLGRRTTSQRPRDLTPAARHSKQLPSSACPSIPSPPNAQILLQMVVPLRAGPQRGGPPADKHRGRGARDNYTITSPAFGRGGSEPTLQSQQHE